MEELVLSHISKRYGRRRILDDITLEVSLGKSVGLFGPNGAGKTTLFYIATGLLKAGSGHVYWEGKRVTSLPFYRRARLGFGYLPQESSLFRGMTTGQNIMAALETRKDLSAKGRRTELERLLEDFGLTHLKSSNVGKLSGGEKKRLEIARLMAADPRMVFLDEPLAGVDPLAVRDIREVVAKLKKRHIGILITDHNLKDVFHMVDKAYILFDGRVLTSGAPRVVVRHREARALYLGEDFSF